MKAILIKSGKPLTQLTIDGNLTAYKAIKKVQTFNKKKLADSFYLISNSAKSKIINL